MEKLNTWKKPEFKEIGDATKIIKDIDVDGTSDAGFPANLNSDGLP
jgi:hypothetical protein